MLYYRNLPLGPKFAGTCCSVREVFSEYPHEGQNRPCRFGGKRTAPLIFTASAAEIMCKKGYQATSMNDIAEAWG